MELRSKYNKLKEMLRGAGAYEEGMEIEEMRQLAQVMEMSTSSHTGVECSNLERALLESEIDFQMMVNSTMIVQPATTPTPSIDVFIGAGSFERDCESPTSNPVQLQVQAVVHHELDWSPRAGTVRPRKRDASESNYGLDSKRAFQPVEEEEEAEEPNPNATPESLASADSGVSCEEVGSLSSISETSTLPSIGEMPSRFLISTSSAAVSDFSERDEGSPIHINP
ncbi:uncharacterized protein LOC115759015 isoform X1 [Drosophila novamexicana]|uniref:uncharacterized protein LOC115759015 isoform X1 n=1 Tax=Drosophila novamexicana TaxID=47314 RepID=UPI0011E5DC5A|nr:uncharacterized protein LOC115759015 isoform X1 [Drosophila novamexicana]